MINRRKSHIGYLLDEFEVSDKAMADILHIHFSLVNKWKNNKRVLKSNSPYLKKIVKFFLDLDLHNEYHTLKQVLEEAIHNLLVDIKEYLSDTHIGGNFLSCNATMLCVYSFRVLLLRVW